MDGEAGQGSGAEERDGPKTPGLTFWATWLTHGEVQLLRSGPRRLQMTWSAKHWNEAMPGEKQEKRSGVSDNKH